MIVIVMETDTNISASKRAIRKLNNNRQTHTPEIGQGQLISKQLELGKKIIIVKQENKKPDEKPSTLKN